MKKTLFAVVFPVVVFSLLVALGVSGASAPTPKNYDGIVTNIDTVAGTFTLRLRDGSIVTVKNPLEGDLFVTVKGVLDTTEKTMKGVTQMTVKNKDGADAIPAISSLMPATAQIGSKVALTGAAFAKTKNRIALNGVPNSIINVPSPDGKSLTLTIPSVLCDQKLKVNCPTTVTPPGTYALTVTTDNGVSNALTFTLLPLPPLAMTTETLPQVTGGYRYSTSIAAEGGAESYQWRVSDGQFPPGLLLARGVCSAAPCRAPAVISGIPTTSGDYRFTVTLTSGQESISQQFLITVVAPLSRQGYQNQPGGLQYFWW